MLAANFGVPCPSCGAARQLDPSRAKGYLHPSSSRPGSSQCNCCDRYYDVIFGRAYPAPLPDANDPHSASITFLDRAPSAVDARIYALEEYLQASRELLRARAAFERARERFRLAQAAVRRDGTYRTVFDRP